MPDIDVVDSTWVGVRPAALARAVADPANWAQWWPELDLRVTEARGRRGLRWQVAGLRGGRVVGSMEVWLQPADDGTVAHYFLRLDAPGRRLRPRQRARIVHEYRMRAKRVFWGLSDGLDPGRLARVAAPRQRLP